jgi:hypothetical protein
VNEEIVCVVYNYVVCVLDEERESEVDAEEFVSWMKEFVWWMWGKCVLCMTKELVWWINRELVSRMKRQISGLCS